MNEFDSPMKRRRMFGGVAGLIGLSAAGEVHATSSHGGAGLSRDQLLRLAALTPHLGFSDPGTGGVRTIGGLVDSGGYPIATHAMAYDSLTVDGNGNELSTGVSKAAPLPILPGVQFGVVGTPTTRQANATAYTKGDLICGTAAIYGTLTLPAPGTYAIDSVQLFSTNNTYYSTGSNNLFGDFAVRILKAVPTLNTSSTTPANADNALLQGATGLTNNPLTDHVALIPVSFDLTNNFAGAVAGEGVPTGPLISSTFTTTSVTLYYLLLAQNSYSPISGEVLTPVAWMRQAG